ncbi:sucrase ferredoxin [Propioniciclava soli]|uniref:sucrase ferredoxin n=1 Tax=Propioniciclava soli TaxID=2775081 RepID=UPI002FCD2E4C
MTPDAVAAPPEPFRCAAASEARSEPLTATASTVGRFVLLEDPGPWGPAVLRNRRLAPEVRGRLRAWERELGVRPVLIRRPGRGEPGPRRVFVVNAAHGWVETTRVADPAELLDWDLAGVRTPDGVGLPRWDEPLLLVCTHGRHDACCAERGRPLAAALAHRWPAQVWESSHLGGDRFAANLLCLPDAHAYGRLTPESGPVVVAEHLAGRLSLEHHRGRTTVPWVAQAAEAAVRRQLAERRLGAVTSRVLQRDPGGAEVAVVAAGHTHRVRVDVASAPPAQLTCSASLPQPAPVHTARLRDGGAVTPA